MEMFCPVVYLIISGIGNRSAALGRASWYIVYQSTFAGLGISRFFLSLRMFSPASSIYSKRMIWRCYAFIGLDLWALASRIWLILCPWSGTLDFLRGLPQKEIF